MVSIRPFISKSPSLCTNSLVTVPRATITIGAIGNTVTFMFNRFTIPKQCPVTYLSFRFFFTSRHVSRTLLDILMLRTGWTRFFFWFLLPPFFFSRPLRTVPSAPIATRITDNLMFHFLFFSSLVRSKFLCFAGGQNPLDKFFFLVNQQYVWFSCQNSVIGFKNPKVFYASHSLGSILSCA